MRFFEIFGVFLKLGLTAFGGPVAHLGFFQQVFVQERRWLNSASYAELVALCQFLPGPASSQVGFGIGLHRGGLKGAIAAWLGFTLPSALIMIGLGMGLIIVDAGNFQGMIQALKAAAAGVVAWALWSMARQLTPDWPRRGIALLGMGVALGLPWWLGWGVAGQLAAILLGAALAPWLLPLNHTPDNGGIAVSFGRRGAMIAAGLFLLGLLALPLLAWQFPTVGFLVADALYRAGALVFGGGHVVLPLLHAETVQTGLLDQEAFLAAYGAAQALPGPLFTFGGFVGTVAGGIAIGLLALLLIFLPGCLLLLAVLPFWQRIRRHAPIRRHLAGVNAAVVGLLAAAFVDPVLRVGISHPWQALLGLVVLLGLASGRVPVWLLIIGAGVLGYFWG